MSAIDVLKVKITGDDKELAASLRSSSKALAAWGAGAALAAGAAAAALVKTGLASADAQAKLAQQLGTTSRELTVINRAADMAGVSQQQLSTASRDLTLRLGQAAQGAGGAASALDRLGLTQKELSELPLSEQMATINRALRDNVPAAERAAVAAELYGSRSAMAMAQINPDVIADAAAQVDRYGAALSMVDAAKIEAANDAISESQLAFKAVTEQLAVQFAPVLGALAERFNEVAGDGEMLTAVVEKFYDIAISGIGLVMDAYRGWQVILKGVEVLLWGVAAVSGEVYRSVINGFDDMRKTMLEGINVIIRAFNRIPYMDLGEIVVGESEFATKINDVADFATEQFKAAQDAAVDMLNAPMPSEGFKNWVQEAEEASQAAAEAAVAAREQVLDIPALPVGGAAEDDGSAAKELERRQETAANMLKSLERQLMDENELLADKHAERLEQLDEFLALGVVSREQHQELELAVLEDFEAKKAEIAKRAADDEVQLADETAKKKYAATSGALNNMASLMQSNNKKLFAIGKAAALAQAVREGFSATQSAFNNALNMGFPLPVAASFGVAAATASAVNIGKIASSSPNGGGSVSAPAVAAPSTSGGSQQQAGPDRTVRFQGDFDSGRLFTGDAVQRLMDEIAQQQANGYRVVT